MKYTGSCQNDFDVQGYRHQGLRGLLRLPAAAARAAAASLISTPARRTPPGARVGQDAGARWCTTLPAGQGHEVRWEAGVKHGCGKAITLLHAAVLLAYVLI
jgi:hypothetical protein